MFSTGCCSIVLTNNSIHSSLPPLSAGMNFLFFSSMYRSVFTLTGRSSVSSNKYGSIMSLRPFTEMPLMICLGGALLWVWLESFCLKSSSEIVVEFWHQLISSRNRTQQFWSSAARNILLIDTLKLGNKTLDLYDLPGEQNPGLSWYEVIAIIEWIRLFGSPYSCTSNLKTHLAL